MIKLRGYVVLEAHDKNGLLIARRETHNLITSLGKSFVANTLMATSGYSVGVTYCALGTITTTPAVGDTLLGGEVARKAVSSRTVSGAILTVTTLFLSTESGYDIEEIGLFGHTDATASVNTGKLFAHALLSYANATSPTNLTVTWTLEVS